MDFEKFKKEARNKSRMITLDEIVQAESDVLSEFTSLVMEKPGGLIAMSPVLVTAPLLFARLVSKLFDDEKPAMDEVSDADRAEKKE